MLHVSVLNTLQWHIEASDPRSSHLLATFNFNSKYLNELFSVQFFRSTCSSSVVTMLTPTMSYHCFAVVIGCRFLKESLIGLAAIVYRCHHGRHGSASAYLTSELVLLSQDSGHQQLRSSSATDLVIPVVCHAMIGGRAFDASATSAWNSTSDSTHSAPLLNAFRTYLKTELFQRSFKA